MLSVVAPAAIAPAAMAQAQSGFEPTDIWSEEYASGIFPRAEMPRSNSEYHDYESTKARMQYLADVNPEIMSFHEGYLAV